MIKKLQKKIIFISMFSISIVLLTIIGIININNFKNIDNKADNTLHLLKDNNGVFPFKKDPGGFSPEAPFETRYFTVKISDDEMVVVNVDKIAAVDETKAKEYVTKATKETGYLGNYKYLVSENESATLYIFLDCSRDLDNFRTFLNASIIISLSGLVVVFLLIIFLSLIVIKPIMESYKKQKQFITDASHELKTPLTVIDASCEVLEYNLENNEWLNTIKDQTKKLSDLTNKLVFLSRMDEENNHVLKADFSLSEISEDIVKEYAVLAKTQNKKFIYEIEPNITLNGDVSMIKQALHLLFDNAFKYSNSQGTIEFIVKKNGKNIKINMFNTVEAIEKGSLNILFERFYRLDSSRNTETGGQGIGLSVVKAIIDVHKGKINAYSKDGKSIDFTIIL